MLSILTKDWSQIRPFLHKQDREHKATDPIGEQNLTEQLGYMGFCPSSIYSCL